MKFEIGQLVMHIDSRYLASEEHKRDWVGVVVSVKAQLTQAKSIRYAYHVMVPNEGICGFSDFELVPA